MNRCYSEPEVAVSALVWGRENREATTAFLC
jgi:hypothetical protein